MSYTDSFNRLAEKISPMPVDPFQQLHTTGALSDKSSSTSPATTTTPPTAPTPPPAATTTTTPAATPAPPPLQQMQQAQMAYAMGASFGPQVSMAIQTPGFAMGMQSGIGYPNGASSGLGSFSGLGSLGSTDFFLMQDTGDKRRQAMMLDAMINYLLAQLLNGNVDALTSALNLITLKSNTTLIGISANAIQAMQQYDKQMQAMSDQMSKFVGKTADSAGIAQINMQMNQMSMARQSITNTLRDVMAMVETTQQFYNSVASIQTRRSMNYRWS